MQLQGPARKAIRALFSDDMVAFFEAHSDLCCEGSGPYLIFYRFETLVSPKKTSEFLKEALQVYSFVEVSRPESKQL